MRNNRESKIISALIENDKITIDQLADICSVSSMTIRRDLDSLEKQGVLTRYHGGAKLNKVALQEISFKKKSKENIEVKKKLAQEAFKLIRNCSSIFLDAGTTTHELAKLLYNESGHTIITNDLQICQTLANSKNNVYCTGGIVEGITRSLTGTYAIELLKKINLDYVFLAASSVSKDLVLESANEYKALLKDYLVSLDVTKVLMVDKSKFEKKSLFRVDSINVFDYIITNYQFKDKERIKLNKVNIIEVR